MRSFSARALQGNAIDITIAYESSDGLFKIDEDK